MSTDRVALITGAARGQGAAIVKRLHKDGFRVAACDLVLLSGGTSKYSAIRNASSRLGL